MLLRGGSRTGLMDGLRERVVRQRARFIEDYDDYVDQARLDLGKLFRIEDYPSKEALQGKFAIRYRITPVPDAEHFIAKLACDDTDRVKRDIERHIEEQLHDAVGDLYRRLGEAVERVSDRLQEDRNGKPLVFRPGGRGWLPTRGSHRSGLAQLRHPAPRTMVSLLNGTHCERLAPLGEDRFCVGARSGPMSCVPGDFADQAICATAVPFHIGIGAAPGSCR